MNISNKLAKRTIFVIGIIYIQYLFVKESIFWSLPLPLWFYEWTGMIIAVALN